MEKAAEIKSAENMLANYLKRIWRTNYRIKKYPSL
jgi:hypothetical protein